MKGEEDILKIQALEKILLLNESTGKLKDELSGSQRSSVWMVQMHSLLCSFIISMSEQLMPV